jgi:starch synthase
LPSRYEPCGLSQLIAMRYGTLPVARRTGGLADTIRDYDHLAAEGTGFLFGGCTPDALLDSVKRALCVFVDKRKMKELVGSAMTAEFPWRRSAERYRELYMSAVREVRV